jgi:hypothetical protein
MNFATAIAGHWQPTKTWTQIALAISKNGLTLTAISATLLTFIIIFNIAEAERNRRAKTRLYVNLPQEDRQIVDAVRKVQRKIPATTQNIAATLQNAGSTPLDLQSLNNKLVRAEQTGLISRRIFSKNDEPVEAWKPNINGSVGSS